MKTVIRKTGNALINATAATLGVAHFVTQTTADIIMEAEASMLHTRYGQEKEEIREDRAKATITRQEIIKDKAKALRDSVLLKRQQIQEKLKFEQPEGDIKVEVVLVPGNQVQP